MDKKEKLILEIMKEAEADGEPVSREEAEEMANMELKAKGIKDYNNVALAMCDKNDNFMVFKVSNKKNMKEEDMII